MSTKTVAEKLLLKPGTSVWVSHADRQDLLDPLPAGVTVVDGPEQAGVAVVFAIDDVWSALRFRASKPGEAPFTGGAK